MQKHELDLANNQFDKKARKLEKLMGPEFVKDLSHGDFLNCVSKNIFKINPYFRQQEFETHLYDMKLHPTYILDKRLFIVYKV